MPRTARALAPRHSCVAVSPRTDIVRPRRVLRHLRYSCLIITTCWLCWTTCTPVCNARRHRCRDAGAPCHALTWRARRRGRAHSPSCRVEPRQQHGAMRRVCARGASLETAGDARRRSRNGRCKAGASYLPMSPSVSSTTSSRATAKEARTKASSPIASATPPMRSCVQPAPTGMNTCQWPGT